MPLEIIISQRPDINIPSQTKEIKDIGADIGKHRKRAINDKIFLAADKYKHKNHGKNLKRQRRRCNIGIFLQCRIQPAHSDDIQKNCRTHHQKQSTVFDKFGHNL